LHPYSAGGFKHDLSLFPSFWMVITHGFHMFSVIDTTNQLSVGSSPLFTFFLMAKSLCLIGKPPFLIVKSSLSMVKSGLLMIKPPLLMDKPPCLIETWQNHHVGLEIGISDG